MRADAATTRLWWVRHAPTHRRGLVGWSDVPADLSDRAALARLDAALPRPALLVSSDLARARATADALAAGRRRLPERPELREIHFGAWELLTADEVAARDPDLSRVYWSDPGEVAPPGGESWSAARARVDAAVDALLAAHPGDDLVIVAHFGVILMAVQRALGCAPREVLRHPIPNLSVTRIERGAAGWRVGPIGQRV